MTALESRRLDILRDVDRMRAAGQSVERAARVLGISARAIQKWMRWRETLRDAERREHPTEISQTVPLPPIALTPAAPQVKALTTLSPAELVSELRARSRSLIVVAELVDGTYLIELGADQKQYELLCALQALKAGARFKL